MKGGAQTALAIGIGYVLGRRRKMRLATMLAAGAATGAVGGLGPMVLKRGAKLLGSTDIGNTLGPQIGEIISTIRGDLFDAGKAATAAAVSSRVESLSDNLRDRADTLRNPDAAVAGASTAAGETAGRLRRRGRPVDDDLDEGEPDDYEVDEEPLDEQPLDEEPEPVDDIDEDDAEEPPRRRRTSRSPVSRTRR